MDDQYKYIKLNIMQVRGDTSRIHALGGSFIFLARMSLTFKPPLHDFNMSSFHFNKYIQGCFLNKLKYILFYLVIWFQKVFDLFLKFRAFLTVKSQLLLELLNFQDTTLDF